MFFHFSEERRIERFLSELRASHKDMSRLFREGQCFSLFCIMKVIWPQAKAWYSQIEGHLYVEIDGSFYDIDGKCLNLPNDVVPPTKQHKIHRWSARDNRRLTEK